MSNYNADIRIGVVGQSKLKTLQKDLDKVNASVKKLNKALVLKTRAQTIKLNTKGATTAIKKLEDRINRLGRTITVNVRTNEQKGRGGTQGGGGGGGGPISVAFVPNQIKESTAALKGYNAELGKSEEVTRGIESILNDRNKALEKQNRLTGERNTLIEDQAKKVKSISDVETQQTSRGRTAVQNRLFGGKEGRTPAQAQNDAELSIQNSGRKIRELNKELRTAKANYAALNREAYQFGTQERKRLQKTADAWDKVNAKSVARQKAQSRRKGAVRGGLAAGALSLTSVPGLQGASQGALIGSVGGPAGAAAGAAVGAITDLAGAVANYASQAAVAAAETAKFELALRGVTSGSDYTTALEDIAQLSDQFTQDLGTTTEQFTKLTAATTANGISIDETAEVYRGLAAANLALGGNSERLQGILLATSQVFSKGKVQAEELRGQIGERLPGAFALFAKAVGKTPAELDKALERGEVTVEDFVAFTKKLFEQFGENAQVIRDAPENAGARLEKALGDLQRNVGKLLAPIGAAFQNIFTGIANVINDAAIALNRFLGIGTENALAKVNKQLETTAAKLGSNSGRQDKKYNAQISNLLKEQARLNDLKKGLAEPPTKPVSTTESGTGKTTKGGGGKSGPSDTTARTRVEIQLQQELLRIEKEKYDLVGKEASLQDFDLQRQELKAGLAASLQQIDQDNITAASKIAEKELERLKYSTDLQAIKNAEKEFNIEQTKAFEEQVTELQNAIALESAVTDELKRQAELKIAMAEIEGQKLNPKREAELKRLTENLFQVRADNADPLNQYFNQLTEKVGDTRGQIASLAQTVETELGTAISSSITGLIDGTSTVQEAFADMFANIGKAFIDMAAQMLAQKAVLMLLSAFMPGGNTGVSAAVGAGWPGNLNYAGGGYTGNAPRTGGVDGRGGFPAILHPQETVVDHHASASNAMGRYSAGNASAAAASAPMTAMVTYSGPTLNFNGDDYIPRSEAKTLVAAGAKQGQAQTLATLKNSRAQRSKLGM